MVDLDQSCGNIAITVVPRRFEKTIQSYPTHVSTYRFLLGIACPSHTVYAIRVARDRSGRL